MTGKQGKRRGFTLVELLIVIIIIGILASAMLMLMGTAEDKARATSILSDMRSMKSAMVIFKLEKGHWPELPGDEDEIKRLFGGASLDGFKLESSGDEYAYVEYNLSERSLGVRRKLALMADSSGLLKTGSSRPGGVAEPYSEDGTKVEMKVH